MFAELLGYQHPPKAFQIRHHEIFGAATEKQGGEFLYGPAVVLSRTDNSLVMFEDQISSFDKGRIALFQKIAQGEQTPSVEGAEVFRYLKDAVLKKPSETFFQVVPASNSVL